MKIEKILLSFFIIISLFSCNDSPVDLALIQDTLELTAISSTDYDLISEFSTFETEKTDYFNYSFFLAGKWGNYQSVAYLRYSDIPDSLENLTESDIQSIDLFFFPQFYAFGDLKNINIDYTINKIITPFGDSTKTPQVITDDYQYPFKDYQIGSYSIQIGENDTLKTDSIPLDKKLIREWLAFAAIEKKWNDLTNIGTDTLVNLDSIAMAIGYDRELAKESYQLGIFPTSNCNVIQKFSNAFDSKTSLKNYSFIRMIFSQNNQLDTAYMYPAVSAFYAKGPKTEPEKYVQAGLKHRALLKFNLDQIPQYNPIIAAEMHLTIDTTKSLYGRDGRDLFLAASSEEDNTIIKSSWPYLAGLTNGNKFIFPNITPTLEVYNNKGDNIAPFLLISQKEGQAVDEANSFNKLVFFDSNALDTNNRPKLLIIYSKWPKL